MNFSLKKIFVLMIVMVFALSAGVLAETYTVGTNATFPPFEYVEDDEVVGFDIDLIKAIGEHQGFDVEVTDISFDSLIPSLNTGNIDIITAGMTITDERAEQVNFSDPYFVADQSIVVREDSDKNLAVLYGDSDIGVQTSTTGDLWVTENLEEEEILTGEISRYDSYVMVLNDLTNDNLDAVVLDTPVAEKYSEARDVKIVGEIKTGEEYGIAVRKDDEELLEKINEGLEQVKESGEMDELIEEHF
ncbi:MAG: basic amino acid ABC transporter substrate-binding protein [Bacillota bacterium]